jgi:lambda family phage tail tape measure protein
MSDYEKANNATAAALAESTYNDKLWQQEVKATETLLNDIKGYQYMTENITDLTVATLKGGGVLSQYNAQLAAQAEVMKAFGDKTFDPNRLNQKTPTGQDAGQVYNDAFQTSLIGGSSEKFAATLNTVHDNYLKLFQPTQQYREELQKTTDVTMASIKAYEQMAEAQAQSQIGKGQADLLSGDPNGAAEIAQGIKNFTTARDLADKAINELKTTSTLELQQHSDNFGDAFEASFQKLNTDAHAFSTEMQKTWTDAFDGMTSALVNLVMTGKANFTDLTKAVLTDIATMIIKWLEWKAISTALNFLLPGSGSLVGDGSMAGSASGLIQLANGGVMTSAGLRKYAGGGIANVPQLAMFGEGSMPEAYVPLPDGRTIPVTMTKSGLTGGGSGTDSLLANMISSGITTGLSAAFTSPSSPFGMPGLNANQPMGGSGGGNHIELHSTVIVQNSGSMTNQNGGLDSKAADDLSKRIHTELRGMVVQEVLNQSRPGGTLNPIGSIRSGRLGQ